MIIVDRDGSIGRWVCERTGGTYEPTCSAAVGNFLNGKMVGAVCYDHYNKASIAMHCAGDGNWLTRDFLRYVFSYPFDVLKVNKIIGYVDSGNERAIKLDIHLGFVLEATLKDAAPHGDLLLLTMTRDQCRFLGVKHGIKVQQSACAA